MQDSFREAVAEFVGAFEEVFGRDWEYSREMFSSANVDFFVAPGCTFLNPGVEDEVDDWGARAKLLDQYRKLVQIMKEAGIQAKKPW